MITLDEEFTLPPRAPDVEGSDVSGVEFVVLVDDAALEARLVGVNLLGGIVVHARGLQIVVFGKAAYVVVTVNKMRCKAARVGKNTLAALHLFLLTVRTTCTDLPSKTFCRVLTSIPTQPRVSAPTRRASRAVSSAGKTNLSPPTSPLYSGARGGGISSSSSIVITSRRRRRFLYLNARGLALP